MIEFVSLTTLKTTALMDRYVLVDGGYAYPSLAQPAKVVGTRQGRLVAIEPARHFVQPEGSRDGWYELEEPGQVLPTGTLRSAGGQEVVRQPSAIRCVCDTPEEVNEVLRMSQANQAAYRTFLQDGHARLKSLATSASTAAPDSTVLARPARRPR